MIRCIQVEKSNQKEARKINVLCHRFVIKVEEDGQEAPPLAPLILSLLHLPNLLQGMKQWFVEKLKMNSNVVDILNGFSLQWNIIITNNSSYRVSGH